MGELFIEFGNWIKPAIPQQEEAAKKTINSQCDFPFVLTDPTTGELSACVCKYVDNQNVLFVDKNSETKARFFLRIP